MGSDVVHAHRAAAGRGPARFLAVLLGLALVAVPQAVSAQWLQTGTGPGATAATSVPVGAQPTATKPILSSTATVTWNPTTVRGAAVTGYVVRRYDGSGVASPITGGTCVGTTLNTVPNVVTTTSCTDTRSLSGGSFTYRIEPVLQRWLGPLSAASTPAV